MVPLVGVAEGRGEGAVTKGEAVMEHDEVMEEW